MPLKVTHQGGESVVQDDATALIGSDASATIRIVRPGISRRHAVVSRDGSGWKVQDAGSRNGTFLDGQRVQVVSIDGPTTLFLGHPSDGEALSLVPTPTGTGASTGKAPAAGAKAPGATSTEPLPAAAPPKSATPTGRAAAPAGSPPTPPPTTVAAAAGATASPTGRPAAKAPDATRAAARSTAPVPARTAASVQASDIEVAQLTAAIRDQISAIKGLTWSVWAMIAVTAALIVLTLFVGILSN